MLDLLTELPTCTLRCGRQAPLRNGKGLPICVEHFMSTLRDVRGSDSIEAFDQHPLTRTEKIMAKNGTEAIVSILPACNFPHTMTPANPDEVKAAYDFRTNDGRWGYGCEAHWKQYRMHTDLGIGKGQKLVLAPAHEGEEKAIKEGFLGQSLETKGANV